MKKKKITFSSSGGTPAMVLFNSLIEQFGKNDIERIAAQIAACCSTAEVLVNCINNSEGILLQGNTAKALCFSDGILTFNADNVSIRENTLIIT
ncbi:MAG: hypothetical protein IKJ95_00550 [Bacteroidaceae bacterium]|nr:hypothetical protein [Bacteroidaceae bacterium]